MPHEGLTPLERAADAVLSDIRRQVGNYSLRSTIGPVIATDAAINLGDVARAVLQAIRDVDAGSPAMLVAGKKSLYSCSSDPELEDARECFQAMIDAALEECA